MLYNESSFQISKTHHICYYSDREERGIVQQELIYAGVKDMHSIVDLEKVKGALEDKAAEVMRDNDLLGDDGSAEIIPEIYQPEEFTKAVNPITKDCYSRQSINNLDMQKLDEFLEKEKEVKYWDLIDRITEVAGEIQDASCLRIGEKGEINGLIQGSKAKVYVETIGAGGYNEGIIVNVKHGQIFHYRTLVHEVK